MELNFIDPDRDLDANIGIALHIVNHTSKNMRGNPVLTPAKLAAFIFLANHPIILHKLLQQAGRQGIYLDDTEVLNISNKNLNVGDFLDITRSKELLKEMLMRDLVTVKYEGGEVFVDITSKGKTSIGDCTNWSSQRIDYFAKNMKWLANEAVNTIVTRILNKL